MGNYFLYCMIVIKQRIFRCLFATQPSDPGEIVLQKVVTCFCPLLVYLLFSNPPRVGNQLIQSRVINSKRDIA